MLLTKNKYSRPAMMLNKIQGIVIHYVSNKNTTALQNWNYFESRKTGNNGYGSAHYIIDLDGSILQCIPENEVAYHCGADKYNIETIKKLGKYPNLNTIGIECCHIDDKGMMTGNTYNSLVDLSVKLLKNYKLTENELFLHYDITGKICHKWFVENKNEWIKFKEIVRGILFDK